MNFCVENQLPHCHHQYNEQVLHFSEILLTGIKSMNVSGNLYLIQKVYQLVLGSSGVMLLYLDLPNNIEHTSHHLYKRYK